jgi:Putative protein-S-isoprenylcysteine methyltransferase
MKAVELTALLILVVFYSSFFIKMILLKRRGINSNLLGRGEKPTRARLIELILMVVTYTGGAIQFVSVFLSEKFGWPPVPLELRVAGLALALAGTAFFISAIIAMKTNWRAGCDKGQNTSLVLSGPYKISRNPAFVGFDLLYLGCALALPNVANLVITVLAVAVFHAQALEEEHFLEAAFGQEYLEYKAKVSRYIGKAGR